MNKKINKRDYWIGGLIIFFIFLVLPLIASNIGATATESKTPIWSKVEIPDSIPFKSQIFFKVETLKMNDGDAILGVSYLRPELTDQYNNYFATDLVRIDKETEEVTLLATTSTDIAQEAPYIAGVKDFRLFELNDQVGLIGGSYADSETVSQDRRLEPGNSLGYIFDDDIDSAGGRSLGLQLEPPFQLSPTIQLIEGNQTKVYDLSRFRLTPLSQAQAVGEDELLIAQSRSSAFKHISLTDETRENTLTADFQPYTPFDREYLIEEKNTIDSKEIYARPKLYPMTGSRYLVTGTHQYAIDTRVPESAESQIVDLSASRADLLGDQDSRPDSDGLEGSESPTPNHGVGLHRPYFDNGGDEVNIIPGTGIYFRPNTRYPQPVSGSGALLRDWPVYQVPAENSNYIASEQPFLPFDFPGLSGKVDTGDGIDTTKGGVIMDYDSESEETVAFFVSAFLGQPSPHPELNTIAVTSSDQTENFWEREEYQPVVQEGQLSREVVNFRRFSIALLETGGQFPSELKQRLHPTDLPVAGPLNSIYDWGDRYLTVWGAPNHKYYPDGVMNTQQLVTAPRTGLELYRLTFAESRAAPAEKTPEPPEPGQGNFLDILNNFFVNHFRWWMVYALASLIVLLAFFFTHREESKDINDNN